jgi:hypothetical protein
MSYTAPAQPAPLHPTTCPRCNGPAQSLARLYGPIGDDYELVRCARCGTQERIARVAKPARFPKVPRRRKLQTARRR